MDGVGNEWYYSGMIDTNIIPAFNLFGETSAFPDVVHCERVFDRAGLHDWVISPHRHHQMTQIFHIEQGHACVSLDGQEKSLKNGEFLYVPTKIVHGFAFQKGTEGLVLSLPSPVVQRVGPRTPALTAWLNAPHQGALGAAATPLLHAVAQSYGSTGTFRTQRLIALSNALLVTLAEESDEGAPSDHAPTQQMQRLEALLSDHLNEGWGPSEFATALHMTTGHLNRIVKNETGASLSQFLETTVMTEACRLLAFTRLSVAEVGYRLGYTDPPYFSRRFRARMGETPTTYRARVAGEAG
ncbi:helix-turn-helix domain-containing protein [Celeribacter baekdonensis]|uniref:helix-turn-helix domain-containing protein n=1 Tax=Celeribacter baekdonensis TaxID=875171 RepID=UPI003A8E777A